MRLALLTALATAYALLLPAAARADAIVRSNAMFASTIAEFKIETARVLVSLEIGLGDLQGLRNLVPDEAFERLGHEPEPRARRLERFFSHDLTITADGGAPLPGRLLSMQPQPRVLRDPITGEPLPVGAEEDEEMVILAELAYAFTGRPERLVIETRLPASASVGFVAYHGAIPINDFRYLVAVAELELDWDDPWYTRFATRSLRRTYFSPISGFIYVEPYEVRKEIVARPLDLQQWVDLGLEGRATIPVEIQPELKRRVAEFLRGHQLVEIDGRRIEPELARIHFLERTLRTSRVIDPPEELDIHAAVLGVIFVYPTDGLPERVTMDWDLWSERIQQVPVSAVDQAGPLPSYLEPDDPRLEWRNFLKNPQIPTLQVLNPPPTPLQRALLWLRWVVLAASIGATGLALRALTDPARRKPLVFAALALSLAVTGGSFALTRGAALSRDGTHEVVQGLLHNVYRAFDYRGEEEIYDVLARSASGDLLAQIYLDMRGGLVLTGQGGARAKVKRVELLHLETDSDGAGFTADATWNVYGSVGHWGHVHQRTNQYRARLRIAPREGAWKLVGLDILVEARL